MSAYALHFAQQDVATANQDMLKSGIAIRHPNKNGSGSLEHTSCSSEGSDDSDQLLSLEDLDDEIEDLPDIVDEDLSFSTAKSSDTTDGGDLDETCEGPCASDPPVSPPSSMQTASDNVTTQQAPAPAECHDTPARKPLRGILRKTSNNSTKDNRCDKTPAQRRSLFPGINVFRCNVGTRRRNRLGPKDSDTDDESTQDLPDSPSSSEDSSSDASSDYDHLDRAGLLKPTSVHSSPKSVSFYPRARILPVPHRLDLIARASVSPSTAEVGDSIMATSGHDALWWSRSDYEHFRHTARILARTLIPHERDRDARSYLTCCRSSVTATSYLHNVWQDEHGDKWWCKFGHSRRGLEHITQIGVGRERQRALVESVSAVLEEQDQMLEANDGEGKVDRRRLARVSRMYTKYVYCIWF
uniref:Uncharacterized protein n=1 Tax=Corethron hystrix TaxID=216773 RepID=A0A7S1FXY1_9STRA|mmetsp:Transcript_40849/g.95838  ORF Transcript_40849/g.95838 Transcript_40849/m.95838 type:complete len:413 (+) Transcript_40849:320-1558(+)